MFQKQALSFVVDDKIPFLRGLLEPYAEVKYLKGSEIDHESIKNADALLIRTRTKCNKTLLQHSNVKFIGSATIGKDHIDEEYCRQNNIAVANAPGCNAGSVMQYVASVWSYILELEKWDFSKTTLGVIGVGYVGIKVAAIARKLGMKVLLNDPPRERAEGAEGFTALEKVLSESDIVSLHVPLNTSGKDATYKLVSNSFLEKMKSDSWLINSSRGEVADTGALIKYSSKVRLAIDVWEKEPDISRKLLERTKIATPHIAGYSIDGKAAGSEMVARAVADFFDLPLDEESFKVFEPEGNTVAISESDSLNKAIRKAIRKSYDVMIDDSLLRKNPELFEDFRGDYRKRWEFHHFRVKTNDSNTERIFENLGFSK